MRKRFSLSTVGVLSLISLFLGMQLNSLISGDNIFEQLNKFKDVLSLTEKFYVDDVDTQKLVESAINGVLGQLDPHSVYLPPSQASNEAESFKGSFEGIGIEYDVVNDTLLVVSPIPGGPSEALGILAGDKILRIDDSSSVGIKRDEVPKKLRGPKGTHVRVSIYRAGTTGLIDFDITRDKIPIYSVDVSYMIDANTGYVSVNRFSSTTHEEFVEGVSKLRAGGMKRLVLDLRNNPGGYLEQAYKMAEEFFPRGRKIVYTKGRRPEFNEEYVSAVDGRFRDISLVILINQGSASASEIVSGAVQDWDRGLVVGETSFGKGLVQRQFDLSDKSAIRLTIARYFTPAGRTIQRPFGPDRAAYRSEAFERQEAEGENLEHEHEKDSTREIFKTATGRTVFGGGGITPDYIVKAERLTGTTVQILGRGVFFEFATAYLDRNGNAIRQRYGMDLGAFRSDFEVSTEMVDEFKGYVARKNIALDAAHFEKDSPYIVARIKAQIARAIWGNEGWYSIMRTEDVQFARALTLFPEAEKIAGLR